MARATMILALDVHYEAAAAITAAIGFGRWTDDDTVYESVRTSSSAAAPYVSGSFFERELPQLLAAVAAAPPVEIDAIVIDGHTWLTRRRPGLGAHLFTALHERIPVVGVAKRAFRGGVAIPVRRGTSQQPLFVSAAGLEPTEAAALVQAMHGPHRLPTLLQRVDHLARGHLAPDPTKRAAP